jgi:hypothetical protein
MRDCLEYAKNWSLGSLRLDCLYGGRSFTSELLEAGRRGDLSDHGRVVGLVHAGLESCGRHIGTELLRMLVEGLVVDR